MHSKFLMHLMSWCHSHSQHPLKIKERQTLYSSDALMLKYFLSDFMKHFHQLAPLKVAIYKKLCRSPSDLTENINNMWRNKCFDVMLKTSSDRSVSNHLQWCHKGFVVVQGQMIASSSTSTSTSSHCVRLKTNKWRMLRAELKEGARFQHPHPETSASSSTKHIFEQVMEMWFLPSLGSGAVSNRVKHIN